MVGLAPGTVTPGAVPETPMTLTLLGDVTRARGQDRNPCLSPVLREWRHHDDVHECAWMVRAETCFDCRSAAEEAIEPLTSRG